MDNPMTNDLAATLDLLQRHHRSNRPVHSRGGADSAEWHSLPAKLRDIREAAASGDLECRDWLAIHGPVIDAVEACRRHDLREALTYRGATR